MRTRMIRRWGLLAFVCLAVLTVWAQTGRPQPPPVPMPPDTGIRPPAPARPAFPAEAPVPDTAKAPARPAPAATAEDLIAQLEMLRKQKADLERQEKDLVAKLHERMREQADRLHKLGIILSAPPPPEAKDTVDAITPLLKNRGRDDKEK
jgi:hypothetical protein